MRPVTNWFERKFEFSFPVELYPNVCIRLRGAPARLEEIVRRCPADRMVRAPQGKWSAQEHAGHLVDVEPLWMARVEDYLAGRNQLTVADLTNRKTHEANHNARAVEEILADFRRARLDLVNRLDELEPALSARTLPHPRMQVAMRLVDHLFFVAEHDDHHLAIIWQMIHSR
jgi:uncharacterized damage-inducible protein DinB